ncbi:MAG: hypothetical protein EPN23_04745 [Verrucomicrobia bacterium]|nr:MAG: hypothetical protein EPN23_04745 [Verrucomicrobiota bacterium]
MKKRRLLSMMVLVVLFWALAPAVLALPKKPAKSKKGEDQGGDLVAFKDIPALPDAPNKDYYAVFCRKNYDALVVASNLVVYVYPKDKGERIDKPIEFSNRFVPALRDDVYKPLLTFLGVRNLAPPTTNASKLVITAVSATGITLIQTWKFADNKIEMEESLTGFSPNDPTFMRTTFHWPETHKFTPNIENSERVQAVAGYTMRWHAGKTPLTMKTTALPYAAAIVGQPNGDWVENQGPWGARKVTVKRKGSKGNLVFGFRGFEPSPYAGLEFQYMVNADPKTKKVDSAGLEIKIE